MPHCWTFSMAAMHCAKDLEETERQSYRDDYIWFIVWKTASFAAYKTVCLPHLLNQAKQTKTSVQPNFTVSLILSHHIVQI